MEEGSVRWFSAQGYGFIDRLGSVSEKGIYFHCSDVEGRTVLKSGDAVTFDVIQGPRGPKCVNVRASDIKEATSCHPQTK